MSIPEEYVGREQSYIKHLVLREYLNRWAHKLGSKAPGLWYVDCFSGPWKAGTEDLRDTSISIGIEAVIRASETWRSHGRGVDLGAIFIEKDRGAFDRLERHVEQHRSRFTYGLHTIHGEFGEHVQTINQLVGRTPAFVLVDPTGWKGAAMRYIRPISERWQHRDILVNVMYDHINRWVDDPRGFIRSQMQDFFGMEEADLEKDLDEEALMGIYRANLRARCGLEHVADLLVPFPGSDRTKFRLVVGGHHPKVLEVFREVEASTMRDCAGIRTEVKDRNRSERSPQASLFSKSPVPPEEPAYARLKREAEVNLRRELPSRVPATGVSFGEILPDLLARYHLTRRDLSECVRGLRAQGILMVDGLSPRKEILEDEHVLRRVVSSSR